MISIRALVLVALAALALAASTPSIAIADDGIEPHLKPFVPYLGKTWRGEFANSTPDKPVVDISHWELALNGKAVRTLHSINDGEYGGESIIFWDESQQSLAYYYFTTAGFYTSGTMKFEGDGFVAHEIVKGEEGGVTEVKSSSTVLPDGRLHVVSHFLKGGEWEKGHEVWYEEAPGAEVVFRNPELPGS